MNHILDFTSSIQSFLSKEMFQLTKVFDFVNTYNGFQTTHLPRGFGWSSGQVKARGGGGG